MSLILIRNDFENGPDSVTTIPALFDARVAETPNEQAILLANDAGQFRPLSWRQMADDAYRWAHALRTLGANVGDPIVQWSENRYEWILADLALQMIGAIHVPLHSTLSDQQAVQQTAHCGAKLALVSDPRYASALMKNLPTAGGDFQVITAKSRQGLEDFLSNAKADEGRKIVEKAVGAFERDTVATILYTSGTTGDPKGIALTHGNILSNAEASIATFGEQDNDTRLNFLPFSHIYARTCDLYTWIARGSQLALARNRDTIMEDIRAIRPTLINGVPYFYQRVHHKLVERGKGDDLTALKTALGGEIRACVCGGAALDDETYDFYHERNVPLLPGYGLTETSPVIATCTLDAHRRGTVGRPIPGIEVRIAEDGEIQTSGPHVMQGYWADPDATAEVLDSEGWLSTGDLGEISDDGFLSITGRKKEMYCTATGKNVFPAQLESLMCRDPMIHQACVVGDKRKFLTALIVPEEDLIRAWIKKKRLWVFSKRQAVNHRKVREMYRRCIAKQLKELAPYEQVQDFIILDDGFTLESGYLTTKLSLARHLILKDFQPRIEAMYAKAAKKK